MDRGKVSRFVFNAEDAQVILDVVADVGDAITDYQVNFMMHLSERRLNATKTSLQQDIYNISIVSDTI